MRFTTLGDVFRAERQAIMEVLETVAEIWSFNLRTIRGKRTQREIAAAAGLEWSAYQRYETGVIPTREVAHQAAIAKALGVPVGRLFADPDLAPEKSVREPSDAEILETVRKGLEALKRQAESLPVDTRTGVFGLIADLTAEERDDLEGILAKAFPAKAARFLKRPK